MIILMKSQILKELKRQEKLRLDLLEAERSLKNSGLEYRTAKEKLKIGWAREPIHNCKKNMSSEKLSEDDMCTLFHEYWT